MSNALELCKEWIESEEGHKLDYILRTEDLANAKGKKAWNEDFIAMCRAINAELSSPPEALCIPEGWKLVPLEPTLTMKTAAEVYRSKCQYAGEQKTFGGYYRAMLAATPSVPSPLARSPEEKS